MRKAMIGVIAASFGVLQSVATGAQGLQATPENVTLGQFNTFEEKTTSVVIKNTGKDVYLVEAVKANCACIGTHLREDRIPPKGETVLDIGTVLRTEGEFSHDVLIVPKDKDRHSPLKIQVRGEAIQPLVWAVALDGWPPALCDPMQVVALGVVHQKEAKLSVCITAKNDRFNMRDAVIDVNSTFFQWRDYRFVTSFGPADGAVGAKSYAEWLVLTLSPRQASWIGHLRDVIRIGLAEHVQLRIPVACRLVGDTYAEEQHISFGNIEASQALAIRVRFGKSHPIWRQVKWSCSGPLSDALVIEACPAEPNIATIRAKAFVDRSKISQLPKGYLFARATLYENEPTDADAVTVLVDGTN